MSCYFETMHILVDDDLPPLVAMRLRGAGHDVREVRQLPPSPNLPYRSIGTAMVERWLIITTRADFLFFSQADHAGILVVQLRRPNRERIVAAVLDAIEQVPESDWTGRTFVVREKGWAVIQRQDIVDKGWSSPWPENVD